MPEISGRQQNRLDPVPAWTVLTDSPLKGLALAREAGLVLAWDDGGQAYLFDLHGGSRASARTPDRVIAGAISDDGSLVALLGEGSRVWLYSADLDLVTERSGPPDALTLAVDPLGRFVAVSSRLNSSQFLNRHGRQSGRFETQLALAHLAFVPSRPFLLGAASYGMLVGIELGRGSAPGRLAAEVVWQESLMSNVGRLATSGDGEIVLASCFTHGVQRYDLQGQNEGAYHLGGTAAHAVPDFAGKLFAVGSLEGELAVLNSGGNVRWRTTLPRPAIALETDPLGRYLIYGVSTGEIVRIDLFGPTRARPLTSSEPSTASRAVSATVRTPEWSLPVASSDDQAESMVVGVLEDPPRIALFANTNRLQIITGEGTRLGVAPEILGNGRILRGAPGWIAAATDRQVILYDARRNVAQPLDLSLVEITQLAISPDSYGLALVQERDRLGRASLSGRWVWKHELAAPVEDLAIGGDAHTAVSTDDGSLQVFDPAGVRVGVFPGDPADPPCLIEAPDVSPDEVAWITLARRSQVLRGHSRSGRVVWQSPIPWEPWQLRRVGGLVVVSAPDGRALAFDGAGYLRGQGRGTDDPGAHFAAGPAGEPWRISRQGPNLICAELSGRVIWRAVADLSVGPIASGRSGVAAIIGRSVAWFPNPVS